MIAYDGEMVSLAPLGPGVHRLSTQALPERARWSGAVQIRRQGHLPSSAQEAYLTPYSRFRIDLDAPTEYDALL